MHSRHALPSDSWQSSDFDGTQGLPYTRSTQETLALRSLSASVQDVNGLSPSEFGELPRKSPLMPPVVMKRLPSAGCFGVVESGNGAEKAVTLEGQSTELPSVDVTCLLKDNEALDSMTTVSSHAVEIAPGQHAEGLLVSLALPCVERTSGDILISVNPCYSERLEAELTVPVKTQLSPDVARGTQHAARRRRTWGCPSTT